MKTARVKGDKMRIIAGRYRRLRLKTIEGHQPRPTLDRVRESFFSKIGPTFEGQRVLDLFAGSGAIGFEVLSRGGEYVVLNDQHPKVFQLLIDNAAFLKIPNHQFKLLKREALKALKYCQEENLRFDWVYLDPPYHLKDMEAVFAQLPTVLKDQGRVYYELDQQTEIQTYEHFREVDRFIYPRTVIVVYKVETTT